MAESTKKQEPHVCEIEVTFPTNLQAEQAKQVLQVDREPTDRVTKSFRLDKETIKGETIVVSMIVRLESKELKMLRVAASSFYDYLAVVVKTMNEFDTTMMISDESS